MRELTELKRGGNLVDVMLADHGLFHLEADFRWIDTTEARLGALAEGVGAQIMNHHLHPNPPPQNSPLAAR